MRIAFDALPLLGKKTGIGYCEAGQIRAMMQAHPENQYQLNYFAIKDRKQKHQEISQYLHTNASEKQVFGSPYVYRIMSGLIPLPYDLFFGQESDITHFFNYIIPPGVCGKKIVTVHDMVYKAYPDTVRSRTRHMLELGLFQSMQRADRIITDSAFSKSEILRYYPVFAEKIRVVPCGVDPAQFHPCGSEQIRNICDKYKITGDYFLYLGTLDPRKNLQMLIKAYELLVRKHKNMPYLVLAGAKGLAYGDILKQITESGLQKQILLPEYIAEEDVCAFMSGATGFLFPSVYEGFGMPPLEAMACGTPVMITNRASLPEVTGDCALIIHPDPKEMAAAMYFLATDQALRKDLHIRGLKRAKLFSWERSADLLYQIYQEAMPG